MMWLKSIKSKQEDDKFYSRFNTITMRFVFSSANETKVLVLFWLITSLDHSVYMCNPLLLKDEEDFVHKQDILYFVFMAT